MLLAIRADGSSEIGYGHLMRTSALARKFLEHGHSVTYLTRTHTEASKVCPSDANVHQLGDDDISDTLAWSKKHEPEILLTDSYDIDTRYQRRLHDVVPTLATITDDTRFALCCDVNINGNAHAPELDYNWIGEKPEMLLGTDYLLMREEFHELADKTPPWHDPPERALITFGGSDMNNSTPDAVRAFDDFNLEVDVIIGPGFQNENEIQDAKTETDADFNLLRNPDDLPQRMFEADFAVSATGSTTYELLATGTPVVGVPQTYNQIPISKTLSSHDVLLPTIGLSKDFFIGTGSSSAVRMINFDKEELISKLSDDISEMVTNTYLRCQLRNNGMSMVDCRGSERIYHRVTATYHEQK